MTLSGGTELGPYEIVAPLGAGGMGEVYRARDTRLDRDVAIKVLPEALARDKERILRFEREAKVLASLNHPNIAAIYGFEESEGKRFLVMELAEGETLAERLSRGPIPMRDALEMANGIAIALEAAHEKGIIHRDLKPANVKVTPDGTVKVLDFGLAKAMTGDATGTDIANSPTITVEHTRPGVVLGTAAYMSPEQARGRSLDKRTDVWSFGCVLYESLTGHRPFVGETTSDLVARILEREPNWAALPAGTPPLVQLLLRRCLAKDRNKRLRDMGDARVEIESALQDPTSSLLRLAGGALAPTAASRRVPTWTWVACAALAGVLAALGGVRLFAPAPQSLTVRKFTIPVPQLREWFTNHARISPDGRRIVYPSGSRLWVRDLQRFEATEIPGSEDAISPFWSPDGTQLGFAKEKRLWTWSLSGGQSTPICTIPGVEGFNHAAWGKDGTIFFALWRGGLYEVAAGGGDPRLILSPDATEVDFHHPHLLPDGSHLVTVAHRKEGPNPVVVISLPSGERKNLKGFEGMGTAAYSPTGHLLLTFEYGRQQILAAPFSESKLEITGEPFLVAAGGQFPSVSSSGLMVYSLGSSYAQRELVWVDREGRVQQVVGQPQRGLDTPALSPDGRKVALVAYETDNADVWIHDLARSTRSRLVSGPQDETMPSWAPNGERLFYALHGNVGDSIMEVPVDGTTPARRLAEGQYSECSPDGRNLVFQREEQGHSSLWRLNLESGTAPVSLNPSATQQEDQPRLSPDGLWLAYLSDEGGRNEVFVRLFPDGSKKQQLSLNGGTWPFWSRGSDAVYYWERDSLMEVRVQRGENLTLETPRKLFSAGDVGLVWSPDAKPAMDIGADGRFLVVRRSNQDPLNGLLVVENWFEEFRKR